MPQQTLPALTGIRAIAALWVVMYHFTEGSGDWLGLKTLFSSGYLGVDLFFILSGYIIHHVYHSTFSVHVTSKDFGRFLKLRFARIWPVHMLTMCAMLVLYGIAVLVLHRQPSDAEAFSVPAILTSIIMVHAWIEYPTPNIPAWSISAEWFAYILFPFVCVGFMQLPPWVKALLTGAAFVAVELWGNVHPLLRIAPEFLIGMALRDLTLAKSPPPMSGFLVIAALITSIYTLKAEYLGLKAVLFAALIAALAHRSDWLGRMLATSPILYLGEISYSIYMVHGVVWAAVKNVIRLIPGGDLQSSWVVWGAVALVLAASALTYHLVELPARQVLRNISRQHSIS